MRIGNTSEASTKVVRQAEDGTCHGQDSVRIVLWLRRSRRQARRGGDKPTQRANGRGIGRIRVSAGAGAGRADRADRARPCGRGQTSDCTRET
jgi:hypothetical protein